MTTKGVNRKAGPATVAFFNLPRLFEQEPNTNFDAIQALHDRLRGAFPDGVEVLSAFTGAIVVDRDGAGDEMKMPVHSYFPDLFAAFRDDGLPVRVGVARGKVEFFEDVVGSTYIGVPINVAARVACATSNPGLLFGGEVSLAP